MKKYIEEISLLLLRGKDGKSVKALEDVKKRFRDEYKILFLNGIIQYLKKGYEDCLLSVVREMDAKELKKIKKEITKIQRNMKFDENMTRFNKNYLSNWKRLIDKFISLKEGK
ncbi:MAG: hypothetical protein ACTSYT_01080 [Candidatus Asgardarchaeia archaeon]